MFGKPQRIPSGDKRLPFIWTYVVKDDDNKKKKRVQHAMVLLI